MDTKAECLHRELIELVRLLDGGLVDDRLNRMQAYAAVDRVEEICRALGVPRVEMVNQVREILAAVQRCVR
jgi:hypothetical protein